MTYIRVYMNNNTQRSFTGTLRQISLEGSKVMSALLGLWALAMLIVAQSKINIVAGPSETNILNSNGYIVEHITLPATAFAIFFGLALPYVLIPLCLVNFWTIAREKASRTRLLLVICTIIFVVISIAYVAFVRYLNS